MNILGNISSFFGLDIGMTSIRMVELHGNGPTKTLSKYAYTQVDSRLTLSNSPTDQQQLAQIIKTLYDQSQITTRNVAVGIPSQRVFTTVVDFDRLPQGELMKSIRYQADSIVPTPLDKSKIDWAILGDSPNDKNKVEVLITSVENEPIEQRLNMLESIGLDVIAFEPDNLALPRAMISRDEQKSSCMVVDIASKSTDIVVTLDGAPRLTRSIPVGAEAIVRSASQNLNIDETQAGQFVFKFGLSKDKLEGKMHDAIIGTVETILSEIEKSTLFFQGRYGDSRKVKRIIVTGAASLLPDFSTLLSDRLAVEVELGNAWCNVSYSADMRDGLLQVSNQFGVAAGLAERVE